MQGTGSTTIVTKTTNILQEKLKQKKQAQEKGATFTITMSQEFAQPKCLLKTQIQLRKKVLNKVVRIIVSRKQRSISEIIQGLSDLIDRNIAASRPGVIVMITGWLVVIVIVI